MGAKTPSPRSAARIIPAGSVSLSGGPLLAASRGAILWARMRRDMSKYLKLGLQALAEQGSDDVSGGVRARAQAMAEQFSTLAAGFLEWTAEARASLRQELKEVVARQVDEMGVATKKDLDALRSRLDRLERAVQGRTKSGGATRAKSTAGAKTSSKKATTRRSG
jgi:ubiquinone biosynthesis protein UbiJ